MRFSVAFGRDRSRIGVLFASAIRWFAVCLFVGLFAGRDFVRLRWVLVRLTVGYFGRLMHFYIKAVVCKSGVRSAACG